MGPNRPLRGLPAMSTSSTVHGSSGASCLAELLLHHGAASWRTSVAAWPAQTRRSRGDGNIINGSRLTAACDGGCKLADCVASSSKTGPPAVRRLPKTLAAIARPSGSGAFAVDVGADNSSGSVTGTSMGSSSVSATTAATGTGTGSRSGSVAAAAGSGVVGGTMPVVDGAIGAAPTGSSGAEKAMLMLCPTLPVRAKRSPWPTVPLQSKSMGAFVNETLLPKAHLRAM